MEDFTPRNAAKFVVGQAIKYKTAKKTEQLISDYTQFEEDDFVVGLSGQIVAWWLGDLVKPYTDKMVDKTADFISAKREEMKNRKKDEPSEETEK
jgi:hypothetical protein